MEENKHTTRIAMVLALMVVMLAVVSIDHFRSSDGDDGQQAAVLRAYAE